MCTKSPTSAEHCALLTGGPARHGSCFANFHSFNSLLSCFSSAFQTAEEGHTVGQADSASCHAEDLCNGIWWSMAAGKTQLKWATFSKHGACCSSLTWKWCRKYKSTFLFVLASWEMLFSQQCFGVAARQSCSCCALPLWLAGSRGMQEVEWSQVVSTGLPYSCKTQHHLVHTWSKQVNQAGKSCLTSYHQLLTMSTPFEEAAMLLVSIPTRMNAGDIYSGGDFLSSLRRHRTQSFQTKALVAFWKIHLSVSLLKVEEGRNNKNTPLMKLLLNESFAAW